MQFNTSIEVMNVLYGECEDHAHGKEGGEKENEVSDDQSSQNEEDEDQPGGEGRSKARRFQSMIGAG